MATKTRNNEKLMRMQGGVENSNTSLASLDQWMGEVGNAELIDRERELELIARAQADDNEAMGELLRVHGRFVYAMARKYRGRGLSMEDLVQEANIGLMNAVRKFDPEQANRLLSYARWWMRQALNDAISYQGKNVAGSASQSKEVRRIRQAREALERESGRGATEAEIAARSGIAEARVLDLMPLVTHEVRMFESRSPGEDTGSLHDRLADEDAVLPLEQVEETEMHEALERAISKLKNERDRDIIRMLFGLETGVDLTLEEVGESYGITRERVRQIRERALKVLKEDPALQQTWDWEQQKSESAAA